MQIQFKSLIYVVICFHFSIFEPLETTEMTFLLFLFRLWFAFILVSLNHWKQLTNEAKKKGNVVICFHFSIFEPLETTPSMSNLPDSRCDLLSF